MLLRYRSTLARRHNADFAKIISINNVFSFFGRLQQNESSFVPFRLPLGRPGLPTEGRSCVLERRHPTGPDLQPHPQRCQDRECKRILKLIRRLSSNPPSPVVLRSKKASSSSPSRTSPEASASTLPLFWAPKCLSKSSQTSRDKSTASDVLKHP